MDKGKILSKGQIVLPQHIRDSLDVHEGNSLTIEVSEGEIILKKVKTIHHFIGTLSNFGMTIDDIKGNRQLRLGRRFMLKAFVNVYQNSFDFPPFIV